MEKEPQSAFNRAAWEDQTKDAPKNLIEEADARLEKKDGVDQTSPKKEEDPGARALREMIERKQKAVGETLQESSAREAEARAQLAKMLKMPEKPGGYTQEEINQGLREFK